MNLITTPILNVLIIMYQVIGDLGVVIIIFTLIVRALLLPLSLKSLRAQKKIQDLQPKIKDLERNHTGSKQELQLKKTKLFQDYNVNPLAGCLPQLVQLGLLIVLYQVIIGVFRHPETLGVAVSTQFFWLDLAKPDKFYILPILAGISQLILSLMIAPGGEIKDTIPNQSKNKKIQTANQKEENVADMAASMQKQMIFIMPAMTVAFAATFPSGLALYWVVTTLFSLGQQLAISGPGGLVIYTQRIRTFLKSKNIL